MESKKKLRKEIDTHIRAIVREGCIIMSGRNNKLKDQKGLDKKGQASKETYQKKSSHGLKGHFKSIWLDKIYINKNKNNKKTVQRKMCKKKYLCKFYPTRRAVINEMLPFKSHRAFTTINFFAN